MFQALKKKRDAFLAEKASESIKIDITLPNGSKKPAIAYVDSPQTIAASISSKIAKNAIIAKVDGKLWDLERPFEDSCKLEILDFEDPDGNYRMFRSNPINLRFTRKRN